MAPGAAQSYVFTLRKSNAATSLTATISGGTDTFANDLVNEVIFASPTLSLSDYFNVQVVTSGGAAAAGLWAGVEVEEIP